MPISRKQKSTAQRFTALSDGSKTYELWNSLTSDEENLVIEQLGLEKGGLPLSKKDSKTQRLLFGKGQFGKVRLARKGDRFFAVKKIILKSKEDMDGILKEHSFGKMLENMKIPNVAPSVDGVYTVNARGQDIVYLFIDKVASLGDGHNIKKLLGYFDSEQQREAILEHAAQSLLQAVATMHQNQIYHRDIKASNVLVSANGQVFLSDFGAATTTNPTIMQDYFKADGLEFRVSNLSDFRYLGPEFQIAIYFNESFPSSANEYVDNWRLGLTLLQLCGAIKEDEGLLAARRDRQNDDGSILPGWLDDLRRKHGTVTREAIKNHFAKEIDKVKKESLHKIPVSLQKVIFGLLDFDLYKRLKASEALHMIQQFPLQKREVTEAGFKNLIHNQISETVKNSVKKALKNEAERTQKSWLKLALREFKALLKQSDMSYERLKTFLDSWIPDKNNQPVITLEQFEVTLSLVQKKLQRTKPAYSSPLQKQEQTNSMENLGNSNANYNDFIGENPKIPKADYNDFIEGNSRIPEADYNDLPIENPSKPEADYDDLAIEKSEKNQSADILVESAELSKSMFKSEVEDKEFTQLQNNLKDAAHQLIDYVKRKPQKNQLLKEFEEHVLNNINSILQRAKNFLFPPVKELEVKRVDTKLRGGAFDENAVKAVFARIKQIITQLNIGKLMSLSKDELEAVHRMLEKDQDFLETIKDKLPREWLLSNPLQQINEKIQLIEYLMNDNNLYISTKKLESEQLLSHERQARTFRARHNVLSTSYIFSEFEGTKAYRLPSAPNELFRNFVVNTMQDAKKSKEIFIYTSSETLGKSIGSTLTALKENSNLKIYINDQLMPKRTPTSSKFAQFFKEGRLAHINEKGSQFTIEELSPQEVMFLKTY